MYVNNQETVFEHTNFRRTSVKGDLDEWVRQKERCVRSHHFGGLWIMTTAGSVRIEIIARKLNMTQCEEKKKQNCILSRAAAKKEILTYYTQEGSDNFERD